MGTEDRADLRESDRRSGVTQMSGLIHEHQYESDKASICTEHPAAEDVFEGVEWALVRGHATELPVLITSGDRAARYFTTQRTAIVPQIIVLVGEERVGETIKIVLLAARTVTVEPEK